MKAIVYRENGGPDVLRLVDRDLPEPGSGEVRVRVAVSGVNPTDWQARSGTAAFYTRAPDPIGSGALVVRAQRVARLLRAVSAGIGVRSAIFG
ncbi:MAG TPA: hypothetical protein VGM10_34245 [Actinocrinis sp.]|jgi:NADPH:quinone reductase-like Zn-dependent oxidoreductase